MARQAIFCSELTTETMNSGQAYRVRFSYGVFSVTPKTTGGATYYYALKRTQGRLFKVYVGKAGEITAERLHQATMELLNKAYSATGEWDMRDNKSRGLSPQ